jgi:hypothetical protein
MPEVAIKEEVGHITLTVLTKRIPRKEKHIYIKENINGVMSTED